MDFATIGFLFFLCLLIGMGIGVVFHAVETGGTIGLGIGLLFILLFRKRNKKI